MTPTSATRGRVVRLDWSAPLTTVSTASLAALTLGGLAVWLSPFGRFPQWSVVVHTLLGPGLAAPIAWYCVRHWRRYRLHPLSRDRSRGRAGERTDAGGLDGRDGGRGPTAARQP